MSDVETFLQKFNLNSGQMRSDDFVHNGGWYDRTGKKIGWGDLSSKDLENISQKLTGDEVFIILSESDSHWNFVTFAEDSKSDIWKLTNERESNPLLEYVILHARYVIVPGEILYIPSSYESAVADGKIVDYSVWRKVSHSAKYCLRSSISKKLGIPDIDLDKVKEWLKEMEQEKAKKREEYRNK